MRQELGGLRGALGWQATRRGTGRDRRDVLRGIRVRTHARARHGLRGQRLRIRLGLRFVPVRHRTLAVLALLVVLAVRRLRTPGPAPRLPARRNGLTGLSARYPGLAATCGQHDTFVRGPYSRELLFVTLSALRHRDSYVYTYGIVGSRYRVATALCQAPVVTGPPFARAATRSVAVTQ